MNNKISNILKFMNTQDRNGSWLEWFEEIEQGESLFDADYIIKTLQSWYDDSNDRTYLDWINYVESIK